MCGITEFYIFVCHFVIFLFHHSLSLSVLFELQQASLITTKEREVLTDLSNVTKIVNKSRKSPEDMSKSADILKRYGFKQESKLLLGKFTVVGPHPVSGYCDSEYICICTSCWLLAIATLMLVLGSGIL